MMKEEGEWNTDEFPDMKQGLLDQLNIKNWEHYITGIIELDVKKIE